MSTTTAPMTLTREHFQQTAQPVQATIAGAPILAGVKEFSTGTLGYFGNGKIVLNIGGIMTPCTIDLKIYVNKSKDLPKG